MKFSFIVFMSLIMLMMSIMMMLSSNSWLSLWVCLELNMFMFIPIMMWDPYENTEEGAIKYFIIQSLASMMLLISIFYSYMLSLKMLPDFMLMMALFMKVGSFPFYFWFPSVMKSLGWFSCMVLSTLQKLGPLSILVLYVNKIYVVVMFISLMNIFIGGFKGCMQSDLRTLMAYSSISHVGWMLSILCSTFYLLSMLYFIFYSFMILPIFMILMVFDVKNLSSLFSINVISMKYSFGLVLLILSLSGLPPMSGFLPKLMILNVLIYENVIISVIMVVMSMLSMYMYLNLVFTLYMFYYLNMKLKMVMSYFNMCCSIISFSFLPLFFMLI
uniref:NADH-ubiquinone oxidoreductase chain 2 n=1 Tax=Hirudo medicinalis TaxID=6421 RepID=A0A342KB30_HIRME|nr:NADH dehydrogenase subunit 2 [Hirudo medicinalis]